MVSSRLVDSPPASPIHGAGELPPRLFAAGDEPKGIRVTAYQKSRYIPAILNALTVDEIEFLRKSPFGKFISLSEEPTFSGRFGRFLMSRQLKTMKKHETWFLFAGVPVRFSLREFAIVTGLPCGKYPKKPKKRMRKNISEKPYWPTLFGKLESVTVTSVITMLKKRTVRDRETRIKYACLALISSVLLPSSHYPKISKDHTELIKDLDVFFTYPWGRLSFDMLMSSMKERNEISLSQDTVSVPGFGLAIQLVLTAAVPALTEVVEEKTNESSGSDDEEDDGEEVGDRSPVTISLHPGHARELDTKGVTPVQSIIEGEVDDASVGWSDEEDDPRVETLLSLIRTGHKFKKEMFKGGATKADVHRMREEATAKKVLEEQQAKRKKRPTASVSVDSAAYATDVASAVVEEMKGEFVKFEEKLRNCSLTTLQLKSAFQLFKRSMERDISTKIDNAQLNIITGLKTFIVDSLKQVNHPAGECSPTQRNQSADKPAHVFNPDSSKQGGDLEGVGDDHNSANHSYRESDNDANHISNENDGPLSSKPSSPSAITRGKEHSPPQNDIGNHEVVGQKASAEGDDNELEVEWTGPSFSLQITQAERELALEESSAALLTEDDVDIRETEGEAGGTEHILEDDFEIPSFSIGMTQEERDIALRKRKLSFSDRAPERETVDQATEHLVTTRTCGDEEATASRKSKRIKPVARALVWGGKEINLLPQQEREDHLSSSVEGENLEFSMKFKKLLVDKLYPFPIKAAGELVSAAEICDIGERKSYIQSRMVDVLMRYTRVLFTGSAASAGFFDSKFVTLLAQNYSKFNKLQKKGTYQFPRELVRYFDPINCCVPSPCWFYFPYNVDNNHWMGLCVDCTNGALVVLDCNVVVRTDSALARELAPVAEMFPYLLRQSGRKLTVRQLKPLVLQRAKFVPQNVIRTDSGVTTVLLLQSHAIGGPEVCKCINPETIAKESQRLAVMVYEEYRNVL